MEATSKKGLGLLKSGHKETLKCSKLKFVLFGICLAVVQDNFTPNWNVEPQGFLVEGLLLQDCWDAVTLLCHTQQLLSCDSTSESAIMHRQPQEQLLRPRAL